MVVGGAVMNRLESLTEKMIREAIEAGEFDNLPGKGQPIDLSENPFEDPDLRTVHRLLKSAGFAPAWIEERKDIDSTFEIARRKLGRAWELYGKSQAQSETAEWERNLKEFREVVDDLNRRIRIYNLKSPAVVFQRKHIDAEVMIERIKSNSSSVD
jgi:DnaJ homolog subfamily C member 28